MTVIQIDEGLRIRGTYHDWRLERLHGPLEDDNWKLVSDHTRFHSAFKAALEQPIGESNNG